MRHVIRRATACIVGALLLVTAVSCDNDLAAPEQSRITISVPGAQNVAFLPLLAADKLGYFAREGLTVEIRDVPNGVAARQLVQDGTAQAAMGFYELTLQAQSEGQDLLGVALAAIRPGLVLSARADVTIRAAGDLRGRRVGVAALGSGTHNLLRYLLRQANVPENEVTVAAIGNGTSAINAVEAKEVDALVGLDPAITTLLQRAEITTVVDTRTEAGTHAVYGGDYAASTLYMRRDFTQSNPLTTQHVVNAIVPAIAWLRSTSVDEIVSRLGLATDAGQIQLWTKILTDSREMFSPTGKFVAADAQRVLDAMTLFDTGVAQANIKLSGTYTNRFVDASRE